MPQMNYNALRGRIRECGLTQKEVAARIGVSEGQLNRKLAGEFAFRQDEMESILKLLDVDLSELGKYFFTPKERNHESENTRNPIQSLQEDVC